MRHHGQDFFRRVFAAAVFAFVSVMCLAQGRSARLLVKVDQVSSGPFGGEKGSLCLRVYSDGRIVDSEWSRSGAVISDEKGNKSRPEKTVSFEYQIPENDRWEIDELEEFVESKSVRHLAGSFDPPHKPIDFIETSTVEVTLSGGKSKTISVREYYAASLVERSKYPSALIILMDKLARLEDDATAKGKPIEPPSDCAELRINRP